MKKKILVVATLAVLFGTTATTFSKESPLPTSINDAREQVSDDIVQNRQHLHQLLQKYHVKTVFDLPKSKVFIYDTKKGSWTEKDRSQWNKQTNPAVWNKPRFYRQSDAYVKDDREILGYSVTKGDCPNRPYSGRKGFVQGFMATSRAMTMRKSDGDSGFFINANIDYRLPQAPGGKTNFSNRAYIEAYHEFSCPGESVIAESSYDEWPNQRTAFVLDNALATKDEITGINDGFLAYRDELKNRDSNKIYDVITFQNSASQTLKESVDTDAVSQEIINASTTTNNLCSQKTLSAVSLALRNFETDINSIGSILLSTNSSSLSENINIDELIYRARSQRVRINVLLGASCDNSQEPSKSHSNESIYRKIAAETGGVLRSLTSGTSADYARATKELLEIANGITPIEPGRSLLGLSGQTHSATVYKLAVPDHTAQLLIKAEHGIGNLNAYLSHQRIPDLAIHDYRSVNPGNNETITVSHPPSGDWFLTVVGQTPFAQADLSYQTLPELKRRWHHHDHYQDQLEGQSRLARDAAHSSTGGHLPMIDLPDDYDQVPTQHVQPPYHPHPQEAQIGVSLEVDHDWGAGYCYRLHVTNHSDHASQWHINLPIHDHISHSWSAHFDHHGATTVASGIDWNHWLSPHGTTEFGYCAQR